MMMASQDYFEFGSGGLGQGKADTHRTESNADTDVLMRGFADHVTLSQSESPESDFFKRDDVSSLDTPTPQNAARNYFKTDVQSPSPLETPHTDYVSDLDQQRLEDAPTDFFKVDETIQGMSKSRSENKPQQKNTLKSSDSDYFREENISPADIGHSRNRESFRSLESPNSNFFKPDDIDDTSRSTTTLAFSDRSEITDFNVTKKSQIVQKSAVIGSQNSKKADTILDSDSDIELTERSEVTQSKDVRKSKFSDDLESDLSALERPEDITYVTTNKSKVLDSSDSDIEIDFSADCGVLQRSNEISTESGWSALETPPSHFFKLDNQISDATDISDVTEFGVTERSGVSHIPEIQHVEVAKYTTQKQNTYDSDVARKYFAHQKQRNAPGGAAFGSNFVNEMLARVTLTPDRPSSASKYPKGIVLSKTFTRNTKTFGAWSANAQTNKDGDELKIVCSSPPQFSPPVVASAPEWKTHQPYAYDRSLRNGNQGNANHSNSERSNVVQSPGIVDESYYRSILQTTPLSHPNTPASTDRSTIDHRTPTSKKINSKRPQSATKSRPSSAQNTRSKATELKSDTDNNGGFTVVGTKQAVGPKRAKSSQSMYSRYHSDHKPSYVDELLFGKPSFEPDFPSPFGDADSNPTPLPYVAIASMEPPQKQMASKKQSSTYTKPQKPRVSEDKTQASKHRGKQYFSNTYVDEGLFGPKPDEPSFKAPWDKGERGKPSVFDGTNYKANSADRRTPNKRDNAQNAKPVWR